MLDRYWTWVLANKEWLFSGAGVVAIGVLVKFLRRRNERGASQKMRGGAASQNLQAGRDIHFNVGEAQENAQSPRQLFVEELLTFCSESKAATTKLFLTRPTKANHGTRQEFLSAFSECELHDAKAQRMQLRARELFPEREVQREFFELLRRTSLVRQSLAIAEDECRDHAFSSDQGWVDAQVRRVISVAARAAGQDLESGEAPFLIGFHPSYVGELEGEDADGQPPSSRIFYEHSLGRIKEQMEAEGLTWDPSKYELKRARRERPEPTAVPRRDSDPDIREQEVVSGFPFEERHVLWLAGYDSRPALLLTDHCYCQLKVRVVTRNIQPVKAFEIFKQGRQPIDLISPLVSVKANELLRTVSLAALVFRAYRAATFWRIVLIFASTVPAVFFLRVVADTMKDPTTHNLWPFEIIAASGFGLAAAGAGALTGALAGRFMEPRPR